MTVAKLSLIAAIGSDDVNVLSKNVEVPDNVNDTEEWNNELHDVFREKVLGKKKDSILYFGYWIEVKVLLNGKPECTVEEFLADAAKETLTELVYEHGPVSEWTPALF